MSLEKIHPEGWSDSARYSHGMLGTGRLLTISGQLGMLPDRTIINNSFADQTAKALENVCEVLSNAGGTPDHLVQLTWYVTDINEFRTHANDVAASYRKVIGRHLPTMAMVEVGGLVDPMAKVEVSALALLPFDEPKIPELSAAETLDLSDSERLWRAIDHLTNRMNAIVTGDALLVRNARSQE